MTPFVPQSQSVIRLRRGFASSAGRACSVPAAASARARAASASESRRGVYVVEMAVVAPVLFLLVFVLVEFSRMAMVQEALTNAAREGGRRASMANTASATDVDAAVRAALASSLFDSSDPDIVRVTVSPTTLAGTASGTAITTRVEVTFSDVSWVVPDFLGSVNLRGESTMKRE